jgi:hypothetical protein
MNQQDEIELRIAKIEKRIAHCWEMADTYIENKDPHGLHDIGVDIQTLQGAVRELKAIKSCDPACNHWQCDKCGTWHEYGCVNYCNCTLNKTFTEINSKDSQYIQTSEGLAPLSEAAQKAFQIDMSTIEKLGTDAPKKYRSILEELSTPSFAQEIRDRLEKTK